MGSASHTGHRKRLKERFLKGSLDGFHDYEALELLLTFAIPRRDVKPLAKALIARFKGLSGVLAASPGELASVDGIGENTALLIAFIKEAARAYLEDTSRGASLICSPQDVVEFIESSYGEEPGEKFLAVYLNTKNEVLGVEKFSDGPLEDRPISPRKVIESAFKHNARSIIFVRNNPCERAYPTHFEKKLVEELESAASAIDILVHDHIISGNGSFLSARELGWLKRKG